MNLLLTSTFGRDDDPLARGVRRLVDLYQPLDTLIQAVDAHQVLKERAEHDEDAKLALKQ